jgi:hypothetical protein
VYLLYRHLPEDNLRKFDAARVIEGKFLGLAFKSSQTSASFEARGGVGFGLPFFLKLGNMADMGGSPISSTVSVTRRVAMMRPY